MHTSKLSVARLTEREKYGGFPFLLWHLWFVTQSKLLFSVCKMMVRVCSVDEDARSGRSRCRNPTSCFPRIYLL